jgi:hypothetical protein
MEEITMNTKIRRLVVNAYNYKKAFTGVLEETS